MISNKTTPTRTYARCTKVKEDTTLLSCQGEIPVEYEVSCRLCLERTDVMSNIFDYNYGPVSIAEKIKYVVGLEPNEDDNLPTLICEKCLPLLNAGYNFKKRSLASYVKLRQYLNCNNASKQITCKTTAKESENNITPDDEFLSPEPVKDQCTLRWDDQVPLAAIIASECSGQSNVSESNGHLKKMLGITPLEEKKSYTQLNPLTFQYTNSDHQYCESYDDESEYSTDDVDDYDYDDVDDNDCELPESDEKCSSSVISNLVTPLVKKVSVIKRLNAVDIEDVPLSERLLAMEQTRGTKRTLIISGNPETPSEDKKINNVRQFRKRNNCNYRSKLKCSYCPKSFQTPSLLARHERTHTGEKPFVCGICCSSFSQKEIMLRHVANVHSNERPFVCKYCDKAYSTATVLRTHLKSSHAKRGHFKCQYCPKVFRHASGLSRHMAYHKGTYFCCMVCKKQFKDGSSVKRHTKLHEGLPLYLKPKKTVQLN